VREMQEELAAAVTPCRKVWDSVTPWGVRLAWWEAELSSAQRPVPNPEEVESVHWWTTEEMLAADDLLISARHFLDAVRSGEIQLAATDD
ncbi:MAG: hypothetical protein N2C14_24570, partial [Planctomycetales bacterium]